MLIFFHKICRFFSDKCQKNGVIAEESRNLYIFISKVCLCHENCIISDTSATQHEVEYLMDFMLSLCHTEEFTNLFKKLCRGIFPRFPDTVYCYAKYYFEEYEDDYESLVINEKFLRDNKFI